MPSQTEIINAMHRRGLLDSPFQGTTDEEVAAVVRRLMNPEFCGIRQNLEIGQIGQRYCRWPQDDLRLAIVEVLPALGKDRMLEGCKAACDDISSKIVMDFAFVDDASTADIVIQVSPLGGPGGVLAQCTLVPCGIKRGQFQGTLEADQFESWVLAEAASGLNIDWQRVFAHELTHGLGLPHIQTPRSLMLPTYSTVIRTLQDGDVDALVMLGYKRRPVNVPVPDVPKPSEPLGAMGSRALRPGVAYTPKKRAWVVEEL